LILRYRDAAKRAGTYGLKFIAQHQHPIIWRVMADFRQIGAISGRMSCRNPNMQNVPRDPVYRGSFRAGEGRVLVWVDLKQIEVSTGAEWSGDKKLLEALRTG
jgi:DNA polymerase-1